MKEIKLVKPVNYNNSEFNTINEIEEFFDLKNTYKNKIYGRYHAVLNALLNGEVVKRLPMTGGVDNSIITEGDIERLNKISQLIICKDRIIIGSKIDSRIEYTEKILGDYFSKEKELSMISADILKRKIYKLDEKNTENSKLEILNLAKLYIDSLSNQYEVDYDQDKNSIDILTFDDRLFVNLEEFILCEKGFDLFSFDNNYIDQNDIDLKLLEIIKESFYNKQDIHKFDEIIPDVGTFNKELNRENIYGFCDERNQMINFIHESDLWFFNLERLNKIFAIDIGQRGIKSILNKYVDEKHYEYMYLSNFIKKNNRLFEKPLLDFTVDISDNKEILGNEKYKNKLSENVLSELEKITNNFYRYILLYKKGEEILKKLDNFEVNKWGKYLDGNKILEIIENDIHIYDGDMPIDMLIMYFDENIFSSLSSENSNKINTVLNFISKITPEKLKVNDISFLEKRDLDDEMTMDIIKGKLRSLQYWINDLKGFFNGLYYFVFVLYLKNFNSDSINYSKRLISEMRSQQALEFYYTDTLLEEIDQVIDTIFEEEKMKEKYYEMVEDVFDHLNPKGYITWNRKIEIENENDIDLDELQLRRMFSQYDEYIVKQL